MKTIVQLSKLAEEMKLKNLTPEISMDEVEITSQEINHLMQKEEDERSVCFERFISSGIPCVIFTTLTEPTENMLLICRKYNVPALVTTRTTSAFMAEIIRWLGVELAPSISIHGVLVDVYGEGVLIMGESGIGKSEAALELVRRGHRLVSDDVVIIRKVSDATLLGCAPDVTKHLIELRGIGIIDVKTLYGVEHVKDSQAIDLVIKLEDWSREKEYDYLPLSADTTGPQSRCHSRNGSRQSQAEKNGIQCCA